MARAAHKYFKLMRTLQNNYEAHATKAGQAEEKESNATKRNGVGEVQGSTGREGAGAALLQWRAAGSGIYLGQQTVCVLTVGTFKMPS